MKPNDLVMRLQKMQRFHALRAATPEALIDPQELKMQQNYADTLREAIAALIAATAPQASAARGGEDARNAALVVEESWPRLSLEDRVAIDRIVAKATQAWRAAISTHPQASEPEVRAAQRIVAELREVPANYDVISEAADFIEATLTRRAPEPLASRAIAMIRAMVENRLDHASPKFAELVREWDAAGDVLTEEERKIRREEIAEMIHQAMRFKREGETQPWVYAGNSFAQDHARLCADAIINRLTGKEG